MQPTTTHQQDWQFLVTLPPAGPLSVRALRIDAQLNSIATRLLQGPLTDDQKSAIATDYQQLINSIIHLTPAELDPTIVMKTEKILQMIDIWW